MSLSQGGTKDSLVPQPHTTAGAVVAIVGILFGNSLGGPVGAIAGLVGGFIIGFLAAVVYSLTLKRMEPEAVESEDEGEAEGAGD